MVNTRPGYVKHGQSVDEAYRRWGYKLRRKRASHKRTRHKHTSHKHTSHKFASNKPSSSDQDSSSASGGRVGPWDTSSRIADPA